MEDSVNQDGEVARLRAGDAPSWETLYRRVYPSMLAYAERRVSSKEEAQDAVSEALTRTVAGMDRLADTGATPESWLFGVLRHVVLDRQRSSYRRRDLPVHREVTPDGPLESAVVGDEQATVKAAFAVLPDRDRELLELRVVAGLSSEEVATILDMKPGAVRTAQARALDKLRAVLDRSEEVRS
ncbi:MAG TPA: sigma-70 family RNA polymerase sigma factor [Acidimicrobiales bacterium]